MKNLVLLSCFLTERTFFTNVDKKINKSNILNDYKKLKKCLSIKKTVLILY